MGNRNKILIVDDEPIVGERLKSSLKRTGFIVDTVVSGSKALKALKVKRYDILVTDLKMSGPDGMDVLNTAKKLNPDIKAVVITGFATKETAEQAKLKGAVEFVPKPFKISQLRELLMRISGFESENS